MRSGQRARAALICLLAALSAGAPARAQSSDEEAIKAVLVDMWDAIERGDIERYASHLHPDFTSFGESDPYLNEGKELEVRSTEEWTGRVHGVHTDMHEPKVRVRGDVAWITYYWTDAGVDRSDERVTSAGKSTRIFVREGGRWLCIHGHYTLAP